MKLKSILVIVFSSLILFITAQDSKKKSELERLKRAAHEKIAETNRLLSETNKSAVSSLNALNLLNEGAESDASVLALTIILKAS